MNEHELIRNWGEQKISHNYRRLVSPCSAEFELIGPPGHPSSYAKIGFVAEPAEILSLRFDADWPATFDDTYKLRIQNTIAEAIADILLVRYEGSIFRGVELKLTTFGWNEVGGSEKAVYRATTKAMQQLRDEAQWTDVLGRYRAYT